MKKSSFVEGTMISTISIVFVKILGMLYVIPFYAMVGDKGAALYAYAYNIYNIFLDISTAGLPISISKLVSEYNTTGDYDAKRRTFIIGRRIIQFLSLTAFVLLFCFAPLLAKNIIGEVVGGNTVESITFVIRSVSFAVLIIPYLSVSKGYLQGHKIITPSSISQVLEQIVRIAFILFGSYLAINAFGLSLTHTVAVAVFGAFVGGLAALVYIKTKINKNKVELNLIAEKNVESKASNKEIAKKIIAYAIPFIIINLAVSIYTYIDQILINRVLHYLNYDASSLEFIVTGITTWSAKINVIIGSLARGMSVSLIPTIVTAYAAKDWKDVNNKLNKALQIILVISIPMTIGLSLLSESVWTVFYGHNNYGTIILAANVFTALFLNLYMISVSTLQSLNKFKAVYISAISGFAANAILDVPMMLLMNAINIPPYIGAILATCMGYSLSIGLALRFMKKDHQLDYSEAFSLLKKMILPTLAMIAVVIGLKMIIPYNDLSRTSSVIYVAVIAVVGGLVYLFATFKNGVLSEAFGKVYLSKIIKKLTFGKVSLKD